MADTVKLVDPDNEQSEWSTDYTTLHAWGLAFGGVAGSGDCVGETTRAVADCRCSGGTADSTSFTSLNGWASSDATYYAYVKVHADYRFDKTFPSSGNRYRIDRGEAFTALDVRMPYSVIEGLAVSLVANGATAFAMAVDTGTEILVDSCLIKFDPNSYGYPAGLNIEDIDSGTVYIKNTVVYDVSDTFADVIRCESCAGGNVVFHNVTIYGGRYGMLEQTNTGGTVITVNNCVFHGMTTAVSGTFAGDYNAGTSGLNPPGSNDVVCADADFNSVAGFDFTLAGTGSALYRAGANLYSDATLPITTDWEGDARPDGAQSLGFDEIPDAGGSTTTTTTTSTTSTSTSTSTSTTTSTTTTTAPPWVIDSFDRGDQAGLGTASGGADTDLSWDGGSTDWSIVSNQGKMTKDYGAAENKIGDSHAEDAELVVSISSIPSTSDNFGTGLKFRASADNNNFYHLSYERSSGTLYIRKRTTGVSSTLASASVGDFSSCTMRVQCHDLVGGSVRIRGRMWSGAEPSSWDVEVTDSSSPHSTGVVGLVCYNSTNATDTIFDNFQAEEASAITTTTTAPPDALVDNHIGLDMTTARRRSRRRRNIRWLYHRKWRL